MDHQNLFSFLSSESNELVDIGKEIEQQLFQDPHAVLIKARLFAETLAKLIMNKEKINEAFEYKQSERIRRLHREGIIDEEIYDKFEWLRKKGNKAAHESQNASVEDALKAHHYLYEISVWFLEVYGDLSFKAPGYRIPRFNNTTSIDDQTLEKVVSNVFEKTIASSLEERLRMIDEHLEQLTSRGKDEANNNDQVKDGHTPGEEGHTPGKEKVNLIQEGQTFNFKEYLQSKGLKVIDKRYAGGSLWVVGGWELKEILFPLKKYKIYFRFAKNGSRSTKKQPAWFLLNKLKTDTIIVQQEILEHPENQTKNSSGQEYENVQKPSRQSNGPQKQQNAQEVKANNHIKIDKERPIAYKTISQLRIPLHLCQRSLTDYANSPLEQLAQEYQIHTFEEITNEVLRHCYRQDRDFFYKVMLQLQFLGVDFVSRLKRLVPPLQTYERKNGEGREISNQNEISDTETLKSTPKMDENQEKSTKVILNHEVIHIPAPFFQYPIEVQHFPGCNVLVRGLNELNINKLGDLPERLDNIHTIVHGAGPGAVKKFWNHLLNILQVKPIPLNNIEQFQGNLIFEGEALLLPKTLVSKEITREDLPNVSGVVDALLANHIKTYGELPADLMSLTSIEGIGKVKVKKLFQQLKILAETKRKEEEEAELLQEKSPEERLNYHFSKFTSNLEEILHDEDKLRQYRIRMRFIEILQVRHERLQQGHHATLEELGNQFGLTRERVRQIIAKGIDRIAPLGHTWLNMVKEKLSTIQVMPNNDLDLNKFSHYLIYELLQQHDIYINTEYRVMTTLSRQEMTEIINEIGRFLKQHYRGVIIEEKQINQIVQDLSSHMNLPTLFIKQIVNDSLHPIPQGGFILNSSKKADIVEIVLKQFPQGVEVYKKAAELCQRANQILPGEFKTERDFTSVLSREEFGQRVNLWGRGTYIHSSYVNINQNLLTVIADEVKTWLETRNFITVGKVYEAYQEQLKAEQIPNEYALYDLLRKNIGDQLSFPKFPRITKPGEVLGQNGDLIKAFIREIGHPVSRQTLYQEFITNRGWKPFSLDWALSNDDEIIPYDIGVHTLLEFYSNITLDVLEPVVHKIETGLNRSPAIQVRGLFNEFESYLKGNGINNPTLLYYLLKARCGQLFRFPRFPHIANKNMQTDELTISSMIEDYILEQNCEVAREEILLWLTEEIGARENSLDNALSHSDNLFYYTRGQFGEYIHKDVLGWNEEKQKELRETVVSMLKHALENNGTPYIQVEQCLQEGKLPSLKIDLPWTQDLLIDCLERDPYFRLLGSLKAIIVQINEEAKILSETDFIAYLLKKEFGGAAKLVEMKRLLKHLSFSKDGSLLKETEEKLRTGEAPFIQMGDELILKTLL